jgi:hypothetical protein
MSWASRERRRTERPKATRGSTISGMARMTMPDSFGLVTIIMPSAPIPRMMLRSACEMVAPTADLIWVVSAVSRETISPDCTASKKAGESRATCAKTSRRMSETTRSPSVMTK